MGRKVLNLIIMIFIIQTTLVSSTTTSATYREITEEPVFKSLDTTKILMGNFHMIHSDIIKSYDVYGSMMNDNNTFIEIQENTKMANVSISGLSNEDINKMIAKRILDFEGETVVRTEREHSKYGITSGTLRSYNKVKKTHLEVDTLSKEKAIEIIIYLMDQFKVNEIKDPRIRIILFDTIFNTGRARAVRIAQKTFNFYNDLYGDGNRIKVDTILGKETIKSLNNIDNVDMFVQLYIYERLEVYKSFKEWDKYKAGWTKRVLTVHKINV